MNELQFQITLVQFNTLIKGVVKLVRTKSLKLLQ